MEVNKWLELMYFYYWYLNLQEKYSSIPEDLGRDINATESFLKRHEAFENELVALEAQVS